MYEFASEFDLKPFASYLRSPAKHKRECCPKILICVQPIISSSESDSSQRKHDDVFVRPAAPTKAAARLDQEGEATCWWIRGFECIIVFVVVIIVHFLALPLCQ